MPRRRAIKSLAAGALAGVVLLALLVWPALADQWPGAAPESGSGQAFDNAGFVNVIPASAFSQDGLRGTAGAYYFSFWDGYLRGSANLPCFKAPVYLPQPAVIESVYASVYDNDATYNVNVTLRRVDNYTGQVDTMAALATTGSSGAIQVPSVAPVTVGANVNYPGYSYYATVCLGGSNTRLYSVRIYYYWYRAHLPMVLKD